MIFIEKVTLFSLTWTLPFLLWRWFCESGGTMTFRYFEASRAGGYLLKILGRLKFMTGERLEFSFVEVRRPDGALTPWWIGVEEAGKVCREVSSGLFLGNALVSAIQRNFDPNRVRVYLQKCLAEELTPAIMKINVADWYMRTRTEGTYRLSATFFMRRTPWHQQLRAYAKQYGITLYSYGCSWFLPKVKMRNLLKTGILAGRSLISAWMPIKTLAQEPGPYRGDRSGKSGKTIVVPYYGKGVTLDPSYNSDLFWVPFVQLAPGQVLVYFTVSDPLDDRTFTLLQRAGVRAVARNENARKSSDLPVWQGSSGMRQILPEIWRVAVLVIRNLATAGAELGANLWIAYHLLNFLRQYNDWRNFFYDFNVGVNVDYNDCSKERLPADQAVTDLGGIAISYQLSDESTPNILRSRAVDVHFSFSPDLINAELQSGSQIIHFVTAGYIHDYAFGAVRRRAAQLRKHLEDQGARFILCFFDENSLDDKRIGPSHEYRAENYRYLLARLLEDPELGVIFKPKKPATLHRRLGPVAKILDEAQATGRCFLFEEGVVATPNLPCEASQAADVAIGILYGTTAALESALASTPTLLLDREGLPFHPLYALGEGRVVFRDWDDLWKVLARYRKDPASIPGFGDWSSLADQLDPFRDGNAAKRIGRYIGWLIECLEKGLSREDALEIARKRYEEAWGNDKVIDLRGCCPVYSHAPRSDVAWQPPPVAL